MSAKRKCPRGLLAQLQALTSKKPGIPVELMMTDSRDMGYRKDFISVYVFRCNTQWRGKGNTVREALKRALKAKPEER